MPFTFSHPLFAAPLKAAAPKALSLSGLILGSMSPDFEYFIHLEPYRSIGHTAAGLFLQAIPLSILFAVIFHTLIKRPLAEHLPGMCNLDARSAACLTSWNMRDWRRWLSFIISVMIGFVLHILLDEWTHRTGVFVSFFPAMQELIFGVPGYSWLQYSLSLIGLSGELAFIVYMLSRAPVHPGYKPRLAIAKLIYWLIVLGTALTVTSLKLVLTSSTNLIGIMVVAPISGVLLGIAVASAWVKIRSYGKSD